MLGCELTPFIPFPWQEVLPNSRLMELGISLSLDQTLYDPVIFGCVFSLSLSLTSLTGTDLVYGTLGEGLAKRAVVLTCEYDPLVFTFLF